MDAALSPCRILLLKDSRPGHFRKSEGVAKALARKLPVETSELRIHAPRLMPSRLLRTLPLEGAVARVALRLLWGIDAGAIARPDLIISTGADTLFPNAALAQKLGSRNVFVGSIRRMAPERFSAVLSARPEFAGRKNHFIVLSPSGVDPDTLAAARPIGTAQDLDGRTLALLVGGSTAEHAFSPEDWAALSALLRAGAMAGARWLVTSSRRTPEAVADMLAELAASIPASMQFIDYRRARAGSVDPLFNADAILVTEDSNTMLSEAVAARRPVIALRPARVRRPMASVQLLHDTRRIRILPLEHATLARVVSEMADVTPLERNPLDVLYELLSFAGIVPERSAATR